MARSVLEQARVAYERFRWDEAYHRYRAAAQRAPLGPEDLAALADAAWWLGRTDESLTLSEQVYRHHLHGERVPRAARLAIEIGFLWLLRGETTVGSGWISRAGRLLEDAPDCAERGYLLSLEAEEAVGSGRLVRAVELGREVQELANRHDDPTLCALGLVIEGTARVRQGRIEEGLGVLDEAMLPVRAGEVSPSWAGNLYCQVTGLFFDLADVPRARAWTEATERWCDQHSSAAMFAGICRVHRAQLLHIEGAWRAAERHAAQACEDLADMNVLVVAEGHYVIGELRRLRDDRAGARRAYDRAHALGRDPQPGLALLRLTEGRPDAADRAIRTALTGTEPGPGRAPLLAARVTIAAAAGDVAAADAATRELVELAETYGTPGLVARARQAAGTARQAAGEPERALPLLRDAARRWRELAAPYDAARARAGLARALEAVGDAEASGREREAARAAFAELGAARDLRELERGPAAAAPPGGLSAREAEVLVCVARGRTNRQIASALTISEKTVARHLSNIFVKLDVSSRTQAAAVAFEHGLLTRAGP